MKYFNICSKKTYESNGQTKSSWLPIGTLREFEKDGETRRFIELNMFPGQSFYVFEPKPKDTQESVDF